MQRLLNFIYRYRSFFAFITLEIICTILVVQNNRFQRTAFLNSSNFVSATILGMSTGIRNYFYLEEINKTLAEENAFLRKELDKYQTQRDTVLRTDSVRQFDFITARVINNSTKWQNNTLTIDKGIRDGLKEGMGVLGSGGVVGKVRYTSNRYSVLTSLLHSNFTISSRIKDKVELCTTEWDGQDANIVSVNFVPRHHIIAPGDSLLTSGYNSIFPSNVPIGVITEVNLTPDATFYDIKAQLVNDFSNLAFVHVVFNRYKAEKDSVEQLVNHE